MQGKNKNNLCTRRIQSGFFKENFLSQAKYYCIVFFNYPISFLIDKMHTLTVINISLIEIKKCYNELTKAILNNEKNQIANKTLLVNI